MSVRKALLASVTLVLAVPMPLLAYVPRLSFPADDSGPFKIGFAVTQPGPMWGDTAYRIGGDISYQGETDSLHFPISELKFPLDVTMASMGAEMVILRDWVVRAGVTKNLTSDAGRMEDSDWGYWYLDSGNPGFSRTSLDIYSESHADLTAVMVQADVLWRFPQRRNFFLGAGFGYRYERFEYDLIDLDQWYPSSERYFGYDFEHDRVAGLIGTYEVTYNIPYLLGAAQYRPVRGLSLSGELGLSPMVRVEDRDDHMLRDKLSRGECYGSGIIVGLGARYDFWKFFAELGFDYLYVFASGTQTQTWYGNDPDEPPAGTKLKIDQEINLNQTSVSLAIGVRF